MPSSVKLGLFDWSILITLNLTIQFILIIILNNLILIALSVLDNFVDDYDCNHFNVDQFNFDQFTFDQFTFDQFNVDQFNFDQLNFDHFNVN